MSLGFSVYAFVEKLARDLNPIEIRLPESVIQSELPYERTGATSDIYDPAGFGDILDNVILPFGSIIESPDISIVISGFCNISIISQEWIIMEFSDQIAEIVFFIHLAACSGDLLKIFWVFSPVFSILGIGNHILNQVPRQF
jgi:hypothetical protein